MVVGAWWCWSCEARRGAVVDKADYISLSTGLGTLGWSYAFNRDKRDQLV